MTPQRIDSRNSTPRARAKPEDRACLTEIHRLRWEAYTARRSSHSVQMAQHSGGSSACHAGNVLGAVRAGPFTTVRRSFEGARPGEPFKQNGRGRNTALLAGAKDNKLYAQREDRRPVSPIQVLAGTIIPATRLRAMNFGLSSPAIATVTEAFHGSLTAIMLLNFGTAWGPGNRGSRQGNGMVLTAAAITKFSLSLFTSEDFHAK